MLKLGSFGFAVIVALGISAQQAHAVPITGEVWFSGFQVELTGGSDFHSATGLDFFEGENAFVGADSTGSFAVDPDGDLVGARFYDFEFEGLPTKVWEISAMGFQFNLSNVYVDPKDNGLILSGSGEVSRLDGSDATPGTFYFSLQGDATQSFFNFSADSHTTSVPDGGASAVLLGLGFLGLASLKRVIAR